MIFLTTLTLWGAESDNESLKEGFVRAMERYQRDACDIAKEEARKNFDIIEMDTGCRCERGDDRLWHCDIEFTYRDKPGS